MYVCMRNSMKSINKIYLTGYMGSGKSHIAKALSDSLAWDLIELDELIEQNTGLSIAEIFEKQGETHFRKLELAELVKIEESDKNCVVSLGGGAYCQEPIRELINANGSSFTVYLKYDADTLTTRLENEKAHRPIIKNEKNLLSFISKHLEQRNEFYHQAELIIVDETNVDKIISQIRSFKIYANQKLSTI